MERCPCCNARLREYVTCSRCKTDLSSLINSEQVAKDWLSQSMHYWATGHSKQSITALERSLALYQTETATSFREFITYQSGQKVLALLATTQYVVAKKYLGEVSHLLPYSHSLQTINRFADYLYFVKK